MFVWAHSWVAVFMSFIYLVTIPDLRPLPATISQLENSRKYNSWGWGLLLANRGLDPLIASGFQALFHPYSSQTYFPSTVATYVLLSSGQIYCYPKSSKYLYPPWSGLLLSTLIRPISIQSGKTYFYLHCSDLLLFTMAKTTYYVHSGQAYFCTQWPSQLLFTVVRPTYVHSGQAYFYTQWPDQLLSTVVRPTYVHSAQNYLYPDWSGLFISSVVWTNCIRSGPAYFYPY
jgi:hypothetical protein